MRFCACGCNQESKRNFAKSGRFVDWLKYAAGHAPSRAELGRAKSKKNWENPSFRRKMSILSSVTMKRTNDRLANGEFPEWKRKHAEWTSRRLKAGWLDGTIPASQHKRCGKFRSKLELRFARFLDILGLKWQYEPRAFPITLRDKVRTYTPDFYIPEIETWIETKGFWRDAESREKVDTFMQQYPTLRFLVVHGGRRPGFSVWAQSTVVESDKPCPNSSRRS